MCQSFQGVVTAFKSHITHLNEWKITAEIVTERVYDSSCTKVWCDISFFSLVANWFGTTAHIWELQVSGVKSVKKRWRDLVLEKAYAQHGAYLSKFTVQELCMCSRLWENASVCLFRKSSQSISLKTWLEKCAEMKNTFFYRSLVCKENNVQSKTFLCHWGDILIRGGVTSATIIFYFFSMSYFFGKTLSALAHIWKAWLIPARHLYNWWEFIDRI